MYFPFSPNPHAIKGLTRVRACLKTNGERGPLSNHALHMDRSLVFFDDIVSDIQPKPGAFPYILGRIEGIENPGKIFGRDAASGVAYLYDDMTVFGEGDNVNPAFIPT